MENNRKTNKYIIFSNLKSVFSAPVLLGSFFIFQLIFSSLYAEIVDLNFIIHPKIEVNLTDQDSILLSFSQKINSAVIDTLVRDDVNFWGGEILENSNEKSDSLIAYVLENLPVDYCFPTDFTFSYNKLAKPVLATNFTSKRSEFEILPNKIMEFDSLKIGMMSIYTPDWIVKNNEDSLIVFTHRVKSLLKDQAQYLAVHSHVVVLISSLPKFINKKLTESLPIDVIVNFDYIDARSENFNTKTNFYSLFAHKGVIGKLRIEKNKSNVSYEWLKIKLK